MIASVYNGPCILKEPIRPEKYVLKFELIEGY